MGRSTENSNKRSNSASPDKANKTPKLHDAGCSLSITRLMNTNSKNLLKVLKVNSLMSLKILMIPKPKYYRILVAKYQSCVVS